MTKDIPSGYLSKRSLIIAVVLTAAIGIGSVGVYLGTASADLTDQEVYRIIKNWHDDNGHLFVSQDELKMAHELINEAIAAPHTEYAPHDATVLAFNDIREDIGELKIDIARLKIQIIGGTGTPSQGTITVSVAQSCYEHGDVLNFEGMATPSRQLTSSIYPQGENPNDQNVFEATPTTQTASNGSFNLFWVIPDGIDTGSYVAKFKDSGGKFGEITVSVRDIC